MDSLLVEWRLCHDQGLKNSREGGQVGSVLSPGKVGDWLNAPSIPKKDGRYYVGNPQGDKANGGAVGGDLGPPELASQEVTAQHEHRHTNDGTDAECCDTGGETASRHHKRSRWKILKNMRHVGVS
mmetsp:Transcript_53818/g.114924  ORF Transcript_53818/g.114924 Transcript_53818/m.114924 type:complete len:126 (-) Transcript_53818:935-1312(-)